MQIKDGINYIKLLKKKQKIRGVYFKEYIFIYYFFILKNNNNKKNKEIIYYNIGKV